MASRFWVGGTGNWDASDTTHWAASSGGANGQSVPTVGDDVTFDGSSGGGTVTVNTNFSVGNVVCGAFTGTLNFSTNNNSPTMGTFSGSGTGARTVNMGSGTWTLTNTSGSIWTMTTTTNLTFNAGTSTIKITGGSSGTSVFAGGGLTYNNLWFSRGAVTGGNQVTGSNIFNDFKDDGSAAHSIFFNVGTTQQMTTFSVLGSAGAIITLQNDAGTSTYALTKLGSGIISSDYLSITHCVATPSTVTWYAGTHSTNNQGVPTAGSGWIFTDPPTLGFNFALV